MSAKNQIAARAALIEQLIAKRNFEDIGNHLTELEMIHVTKEHLQETDVVRVVYRVLKHCPTVTLKKKAKCLLSKWRALYRMTHCKPIDNPQLTPMSGNKEENSGHSHDPSQDEIMDVSSSNPWPSFQDVAEAIEMIVPANSAVHVVPKEGHCSGCDLTPTGKESSESLVGPTTPLRTKSIELLYKALTSSSTDLPKADLWQKFAREIEEHIFALYSGNLKKYKTCIRSKVSNLKNPRNSHLQQNLLSGTMSPREFAAMTVLEMANQELKDLRAAYTESSIQEHRLPQELDGTPTNKIKCRRCEKYNCKVTVIARGALFLPSWVRNSNPDEQMMTYVICNECGEQWYHSKWVCL
ncbi:transcription elongation factor A N-terminal and central domain-containing protein [Elephas maximus indicus]|uniref:transcription elongation factor A N-terminal and central domain-containing protein n=1 Tax=Elephas maximus indicus TaxID=99487 RepID=UPI00211639E2|nr:transcription elongation factor A N-terminal and central domain-containing protein [Elephas maximus indicus]XP_049728393.1 transcription elongation factor A N-terminal and central domain-containing protein [Elephas maximus indicus]XP_049728394.1 transcription elongation factor A N-terminal and central domain-containing protein [Elephas maximus indicus]